MKKKILYVSTKIQAVLFELEIKGQLSDGRWENSLPNNHWKAPCEADVIVRPEQVGRNFSHMRGYNFGEKILMDCVGERMLRYAKAVIAFPEVDLEGFKATRHGIDDDYAEWYYKYKCDEIFGVGARMFEDKINAITFTKSQLQKEVSGLTSCFRKEL